MTAPSVRDLLASGALTTVIMIAGAEGTDRVATEVTVIEAGDTTIGDGAVVLLDLPTNRGGHPASHLLDPLLHRLSGARAAALIVCGVAPDALPLATRRLADRGPVPLLVSEHCPSHRLAAELMLWTRRADLQNAHALLRIARALHASDDALTAIVGALANALEATVAVLSADGALVAGQRPPVALNLDTPAPFALTTADGAHAALPVLGASGIPELWLVAYHRHGGTLWRDRARDALALAGGHCRAWLANQALSAERDARYRSTLLTEILTLGSAIPADMVAVASHLGWQLAGWHTGIHLLRLHRTANPTTATDLHHGLGRAGIGVGPLVERADGWACWVTATRPPTPQTAAMLTDAVTRALHDYIARPRAAPVVAGIGQTAPGPSGLATTLHSARHAAIASAVANSPGSVQHADQVGAAQFLIAACTSPALRETARSLLAVLDAEPNSRELLATLETYLDTGDMVATGTRVSRHRNTVAKNIARAATVLGIDLDDPTQRLALHLACRAQRITTTDEPS